MNFCQCEVPVLPVNLVRRPAVAYIVHDNLSHPRARMTFQAGRLAGSLYDMRISDRGNHCRHDYTRQRGRQGAG